MIDPKEIKALHREAMETTDLAFAARKRGNKEEALSHFRKAYSLEAKAALALSGHIDAEPNRSVLFRSAASLALDCNLTTEAEKLICAALSGDPPAEIAEELGTCSGRCTSTDIWISEASHSTTMKFNFP
jgi:hypothetical protein